MEPNRAKLTTMKSASLLFLCAALMTSAALSAPAAKTTFTKSRFPGVQVRHVPQKQASVTGRSSVKVLPGSPHPQGLRATTGTRAEPILSGKGVTAKGGNWVRLPANRRPLETAHRLKNGKVVVGCPPHSVAKVVKSPLPASH